MRKGSPLAYLGAALILMPILVILLLDIGGWGAFALDITTSVAVQVIAAAVLLGLVLAILEKLIWPSPETPPKFIVLAVSVIVPVMVLPVLPNVFKRPIDLYDWAQTLILAIVFFYVVHRYQGDPERPSPEEEEQPEPPEDVTSQDALYQVLLNMVLGDKDTAERLIAYERNRAPFASREEHIQSAIQRLERDRR